VCNPRQNEAFRRFLDWTIFMGLPVPPAAEDVAGYFDRSATAGDGLSSGAVPIIRRASESAKEA
jgi:hypothetical protein